MDQSSQEIVDAIHKQVQAEMETAAQLKRQNDLAEKSLGALERNRKAEQARIQVAFETSDKVTGLITILQNVLVEHARLRRDIKTQRREFVDYRKEFENWMERTNDILLLLLTEKSPAKVAEALEDLQDEVNRTLIRQRTKNLMTLKEQAAKYGTGSEPLHLLNDIEREEEALERLKVERQIRSKK